ncbi:MAG: glutaminyl-peptide cyclotransferase [Candidatus Delongbacteria bacterium]|nr:glutaminyl-peptide cyclotransferase [Candidatus Delongbacteria bacterium]MCG2761146.1 glutaminyl-peptide cyclotransferase [Candidatus Delongbacteria bacterium]
MKSLLFLFLSFLLFAGCNKEVNTPDSDYDILNIYPHNTSYFTQGFEFVGDTLIEGTGKNGYSKIVKYNFNNGQVYQEINLPSIYFGEGITVFNNKVYQLTWKSLKCLVYNYSDLEKINEFSYTGEGWGLTNDGTNLIMSDGSDKVYFRNPEDFSLIRTIIVKDSNNISVSLLNELEFAEGKLYANIWGSNYIISIDPQTGSELRRYYLNDLLTAEEYYQAEVLNGIAYRNGNFFITGKYWPKIFEIKLIDK